MTVSTAYGVIISYNHHKRKNNQEICIAQANLIFWRTFTHRLHINLGRVFYLDYAKTEQPTLFLELPVFIAAWLVKYSLKFAPYTALTAMAGNLPHASNNVLSWSRLFIIMI